MASVLQGTGGEREGEKLQEVKDVAVERPRGEGDSQVCHVDFRKRGVLPPVVRYCKENRSVRPHRPRPTTAGPRHAAATFKSDHRRAIS